VQIVSKDDIIIKSNKGQLKKGKAMSKYNITINEINQDNDQHTASGIIIRNGEEVQFESVTIWYDGTRRWKVKEEAGTAVAVEQSGFSKGERMAIARWLKAVSKDPELVGKSSGQGSGKSGGSGSSSRIKELEEQNIQLQGQVAELMEMMKQFMNKDS
tara:strand:+ start:3903 stop:4376 length:474 start_codon:yes stop_codon:yes gene_type:complete